MGQGNSVAVGGQQEGDMMRPPCLGVGMRLSDGREVTEAPGELPVEASVNTGPALHVEALPWRFAAGPRELPGRPQELSGHAPFFPRGPES